MKLKSGFPSYSPPLALPHLLLSAGCPLLALHLSAPRWAGWLSSPPAQAALVLAAEG